MNDELRRARIAVTTVFFVNGTIISSLFVRLPAIKEDLDLGDGELGLALLGMMLGLVVAQLLAGALAARYGSRPVTIAGAVMFVAVAVLPALAESLGLLIAAMVALGMANGTLDVSMNVQGASVEREAGRPLLASMHAAFSFGALSGAAAGGVGAELGVSPAAQMAGIAALATVAVAAVARELLPASADASRAGPLFARPSRPLAALGLLAFCVLLAEGSVTDWSAVYLRETLDSGPGPAAAGLSAFSLTMATGRLLGDRLAAAFGPPRLTRAAALLAMAGSAATVAAPGPALAIAGFAALGAGLSVSFPLAIAAAAERAGSAPGPAIAAVSTAGYLGFVTGPPLIGALSEATSLRAALCLVTALCLVAAWLARAVDPVRHP